MADTRVGGAYIDFSARTGRLLTGLRNTGRAFNRQQQVIRSLRRTIQGFNRTAQAMVRRVTSLRGAVATLAGSSAMGLLIRRHVEAADETIKLARAVGLSTDAFQELRFAFDLGGISAGEFTSAMIAFSKRTGEARVESGTMTTILKRMDEQLFRNVQAAQTTEEAFGLIVGAAVNTSNELERTALLAAAFGRTVGPKLANLLLQGTAGIDQLRQRARELGVVLDESALRSSENLNDRFTELAHILNTQVRRGILNNADAIEGMANNLIELVPTVARFADAVTRGFSYLVDNARTILVVLATVRTTLAGVTIGSIFGPIGAAVGAVLGGAAGGLAANQLLDLLDQHSQSAATLRDRLDEARNSLAGINRQIEEGRNPRGLHILRQRAIEAREEIKRLEDQLATFATVTQAAPVSASGAASGAASSQRRLSRFVNDAETELRLLDEIFGRFDLTDPLRNFNDRAVLTLRKNMVDLDVQIQGTFERLEEWPEPVMRVSREFRQLQTISAGIGQNLGVFVADLGRNIDSLSESIANLGREILQLLKTELIARPVAEALTRGIRSNFPGLLASIPSFQRGGIAHGLSLVGEDGPELANFRQPTRILPADITAGLLGGSTVNVSLVVEGADAAHIEQVIEGRVLPRLVPVVEAAVAEGNRRR